MKEKFGYTIRVALIGALYLFACRHAHCEEVREWTAKTGKSVKAEFVKFEDGQVFLKLEDGNILQAQIEKLCDEDRFYILEKTTVAKEINVAYGVGRDGYLRESGESPDATYKDTVTFTITGIQPDGSAKTVKDSRWQYVAAETYNGKIDPVRPGYDKALSTEGKFLLVKFSVENDSPLPVAVPPPLLIDQRDRKYLPLDNYNTDPYVPEGFLRTEADIVQPGFKKNFCTLYEVPPQSEISALEVFPVRTQPFQVRSFNVAGKRIHVRLKLPDAEGESDSSADENEETPIAERDFNLFLKCIRLSQSGGRTAGYYYDYNKQRSLAYGVELRTTSKKQEALELKAFFIGQTSSGKDVVVDQKKAGVKLEPGRIERVSLQSEEIRESYYYYYDGSSSTRTSAKLKGVIIQVWQGNDILKGYASLSQWKKYTKSKRIVEELGELRRFSSE